LQRVLTIAGTDPGGGAGVAADLKTIALLGAHGLCCVAALTAQNSTGVKGIHPVPPQFVAAQLEAVLSDIGCDAAKCGMLYSAEVIRAVADQLAKYRVPHVVIDTVLAAGSGDPLAEAEALAAYRELFPLAALVSGNLSEVSALTGIKVTDEPSMREAARALVGQGAKAALVRGGHLSGGEAVDILHDGQEFYRFSLPRVNTPHDHGTGCTTTAAIATYLARGHALPEAVRLAKELVHRGLRDATPLGAGKGPVNILAALGVAAERCRVLSELSAAFEMLRGAPGLSRLIPEVGMNLAFALPAASSVDEVAAFPGRLGLYHGRLTGFGPPEFGASSHVARIVLTAMQRDPGLRAALNIRHGEDVIAACRAAGLKLSSFDRAQEPPEVAAREGGSLVWGVAEALKDEGLPQAVYDTGGLGKEPMVRLLGRTPGEVARWAIEVAATLTGD
jgi:hydroxymethylpyrimidine/phosphomethylpyrimidine kinase